MSNDNEASTALLGNFFNARLSWSHDERQFSRSVLVVATSDTKMSLYIPKGCDRPWDATLHYPGRSDWLFRLERTEDEGLLTLYRIVGSIDEEGKNHNLPPRAKGQWEKNHVSDGAKHSNFTGI